MRRRERRREIEGRGSGRGARFKGGVKHDRPRPGERQKETARVGVGRLLIKWADRKKWKFFRRGIIKNAQGTAVLISHVQG